MTHKEVRTLHRCMYCSFRDSVIAIGSLESCLKCLRERIHAVEPGYKVELTVSETGYDFDPLTGEEVDLSGT